MGWRINGWCQGINAEDGEGEGVTAGDVALGRADSDKSGDICNGCCVDVKGSGVVVCGPVCEEGWGAEVDDTALSRTDTRERTDSGTLAH